MLDQEWLKLILQAKQLGISLEEVRSFLYQEKENELIRQDKQLVSSIKKNRV